MASFFTTAGFKAFTATILLAGSSILMGARSNESNFLHGIDVSRYQAEVNWEHVRESNIAFAFMKATEGNFLRDPYFKRNWESSRQHGIKRGAYHFYLPWVDVDSQLELFKSTVDLQPGDLAPVLDLETYAKDISDAQMRADIKRWLVGIEEHYGIKPIIYTYQGFYDKKLRGHFAGYKFWIARYKNEEPSTHPNDKMAFWQYSEKGTVKGINTPVDVNWFYGDINALNAHCLPAPAKAPTTTASPAMAQAEPAF
ncbi:glycoside hydrolase family 25 protein [Nibribacter koreensis]|uniref:Lysozyme n=1 Tax=Nibribacter koreensis TaxID=1084519 RepID=A0ABP8FQ40_9BACT